MLLFRWLDGIDEATVQNILSDWALFSEVVKWVTTEIKAVCQVDEEISLVKDAADVSTFKIELTSMLNGKTKDINSRNSRDLTNRLLCYLMEILFNYCSCI